MFIIITRWFLNWQGQSSTIEHLCPDLDIFYATSQTYNWRFRPPKGVIFNNLEISLKALHFFYYLQDMIQSLAKSNNTIIQICIESMQKSHNKLLKSITPKPSGVKSWNFRTSKIRKLCETFVFTTSKEILMIITKLFA